MPLHPIEKLWIGPIRFLALLCIYIDRTKIYGHERTILVVVLAQNLKAFFNKSGIHMREQYSIMFAPFIYVCFMFYISFVFVLFCGNEFQLAFSHSGCTLVKASITFEAQEYLCLFLTKRIFNKSYVLLNMKNKFIYPLPFPSVPFHKTAGFSVHSFHEHYLTTPEYTDEGTFFRKHTVPDEVGNDGEG